MIDCVLVQIPIEEQSALAGDAAAIWQIIERSEQNGRRLELGEAWGGLHFVLSGEVPIPKQEALRRGISWDDDSMENVLFGGMEVPYVTSWGLARYLEPATVARMARQLSAISLQEFQDRYDPEALQDEGIPPDAWEEPETRDWLAARFLELVEFYKNAALKRAGILICMI